MQQRLNFWRSALDRKGLGLTTSWDSTWGILWQPPCHLRGRFCGSVNITLLLISFRNSHVVVSHDGGAISGMS